MDKDGKPMVALHWEHYFKHICQKYNSIYKVQILKVTPHVCGHTFCSNMATYTHLGFEDARAELKRVASGG